MKTATYVRFIVVVALLASCSYVDSVEPSSQRSEARYQTDFDDALAQYKAKLNKPSVEEQNPEYRAALETIATLRKLDSRDCLVTLATFNDKSEYQTQFVCEGDVFRARAQFSQNGRARDGFLYLFSLDENGAISFLNPTDAPVAFTSNGTYVSDEFIASAPFGPERIVALATTYEVPCDDLADKYGFVELKRFRSFIEKVARGLSTKDERKLAFAETALRTFAKDESVVDVPREDAQEERVFHVGVAVDVYADMNIDELYCAVKSVKNLKNLLVAKGAVDESRVILLLNADATLENVRFLFQHYLPAITGPNDRVVVHWCGHGAAMSKTNSTRGGGDTEMRLVLHDTTLGLKETFLNPDTLDPWIETLRAQTLFLFESCYSGRVIDPEDLPFSKYSFVTENKKGIFTTNSVIITACGRDQTARVSPNDGLGLMTAKIIEYLQDKEELSARTMFDAVREEIERDESSTQTMNCIFGPDNFVLKFDKTISN